MAAPPAISATRCGTSTSEARSPASGQSCTGRPASMIGCSGAGGINPAMRASSVDLPAPLGPATVSTCPAPSRAAPICKGSAGGGAVGAGIA